MSLHLNVSNSLKNLAGQLSMALKEQGGSVFQKQWLVTQTDGMNNWLTIQLATQLGISANCRFVKPNDIIGQLYYWLGGDSKQVLAPDQLQWLIYQLLGEEIFRKRFAAIAGYYTCDDVRRIALARKTADLFDQYQVYRPEMVDEWNLATVDEVNANDWQKYLWIQVKEKTGLSLTDKTSVIRYIIKELDDPAQQQRLFDRLPDLHIFGVSIITHFHIHLFNELSKYISVRFYLLNPAPLVYWLDDQTQKQIVRLEQLQKKKGRQVDRPQSAGNNLLISWGKVIQETFSLLFEREDFLNVYDDAGVNEPAIDETNTLLRKIQSDIFYNAGSDSRLQLTLEDIRDSSVSINACYTPVREVESLYNYLVYLVDQQKESLSPRDIVVMVSDIDAYAPYIKAIFNTALYPFPFTIADESYHSGESLFTAVEGLLSIPAESFKAEEVMQLLDSRYIRQRFDITDTALVRKVVSMANIRFGITGNKDDDTTQVSWKTGLQRILYGICMSGSDQYDTGDGIIYPLDVVEGEDALELVRFYHFFERLKWYVYERENKRTLAGWGEYIQQLVDDLVYQQDAGETEDDYQRLILLVENLAELTVTYNEVISFDVFKHSFLEVITANTRSGAFATGGITFCSLIPMRSIPFKVVALLGMNFDKFPRREVPLSFNLMEQKRRKGDRNVKDNDKHLFLETVLSAQDYLYISYIGRNAKDNSIHPPSALVDELVDYIESGVSDTIEKLREELITVQPLHAFSQQYFKNLRGLYSYLGDKETVENINQTIILKENQGLTFDEILPVELLAFFRNPFKWYYNKTLAIYYKEEEVLLPDTEIFELDALQQWSLKNDLLKIGETDVEAYRLQALNAGNLPLKHMADIEVERTLEDLLPAKKLFNQCVVDEPERELTVNITVDNSTITGKINGVYGSKILVISFSKNHYKYLLEGYLKYVMLTANGEPMELNYLSARENEIFKVPANAYSKAGAMEVIGQLVDWFKKGYAQIFLLYPGFQENPLKLAASDPAKFNNMIGKFLEHHSDEYLQREFDQGIFKDPVVVQEFFENTRTLFLPVAQLFPDLIPLPKQ